MKRLLLVPILCAIAYAAYAITVPFVITVGGSGDFAFSLPNTSTLKFMAPSGHDTCDGLGTSTGTVNPCAWQTPNHAMNCGEVILAGPGTYSSNLTSWGTVSNCPSSSGGIDGTGGIYFAILLCAGSDLEACQLNTNNGSDAMGIAANNWSVQGWKTTTNNNGAAYMMEANSSGTDQKHHFAFVNNICYGADFGFQGNEGGRNQNVPGNGVDYYAFIGLISQNCATGGFGEAGINIVAPSAWDSVAGTHIFSHGSFAISNHNSIAIDGESYMFDAFDAHGYTGTVVMSNNIGFNATRNCIEFTDHVSHNNAPSITVYNNTCYGNLSTADTVGSQGEITLGVSSGTFFWVVNLYNNIASARYSTTPGGTTPIWALLLANFGGSTPGWDVSIHSGDLGANVYHGIHGACQGGGICDAGFNVQVRDGSTLSTHDTYLDPAFTNTTDLITNRIGVPNCTGFVTTTACMGYDATTSTLTTPSVISDLVPTAGGTSGKGYQLPSVTCAANSDYPAWLKGIVYLKASGFTAGATITEKAGLVSKPCNM